MPFLQAHKARTLLAFALCLGVAAIASANAGVVVREIDFLGNRTATDRDFYYDESNDPPTPGGTYPAVEVPETPGPIIRKVVYLRGQEMTVKIKVKSTVGATMVGVLSLETPYLDCPGGYNYRNPFSIPLSSSAGQVITLSPQGTATATFTLSGAPNYVAYGDLKFTPKFVCITPYPGYQPMSPEEQPFRTYLIDSASVGLQSAPWTDLLEYACDFAFFGVGADDVSDKLCKGLFWSGRVYAYNLGSPNISAQWYTDDFEGFLMKPLLEALNSDPSGASVIQHGSCSDVSAFLEAINHAQGIGGQMQQLWTKNGAPDDIDPLPWVTNSVVGIGSDGTADACYSRLIFTMHQQFVRGARVYDSALAYFYNLSGASYKNPASDWCTNPYWQTLALPNAYGLTYRLLQPSDLPLSPPTTYVPFEHLPVVLSPGANPVPLDVVVPLTIHRHAVTRA